MKINSIKICGNEPSFGLRIVQNDDLKKIIDLRLRNGENKKGINDSFERMKKVCDDDLSLEFKNYHEAYDPYFFGYFALCNLKFSGKMRASGSNKKYGVESTTKEKYIASCPNFLIEDIKIFLSDEQKKIDSEDRT